MPFFIVLIIIAILVGFIPALKILGLVVLCYTILPIIGLISIIGFVILMVRMQR